MGPDAVKTVTGTLAVADAAFHYPGAPAGVEALAFHARFAPDSLGIGDLAARVQGQPLRGRLSMTRFKDPLVAFAVEGNVDLAAVAPLVAPKDTKLAGRAAVNVAGNGRAKDPGTLRLAGNAKLTQVSVESPQVPKKIEAVNGLIAFNNDWAQVTGLSAKAGTSSFAMDGRVTRPFALLAKVGSTPPSTLNFDFHAPRLDLAEVVPPAQGPPIVLNATGGGRVAIDRLINQKLDVAQVRANVVLEPGIVNAPSFTMKAYDGVIGGSARLDLRDPASPGVAIKAKVDSLSADALVSAWTPAKNFLQGSLNSAIDLSLSGATPDQIKRTLTAVGLAQMVRGQLGPGPVLAEIAKVVKVPSLERLKFDDAKLPFRIERGRIVNDPTTLRGSFGEWKIAGAVGFDGSLDYAVSATLPPAATAALGARSALAAGALTDAQGNLLLDLRVTGTAKSPSVTWDPTAMKDRVLGKASQALQAQQQKIEDEVRAAAAERQAAAEDSARRIVARAQQAVRDSLRRLGGDVLRGFFGGGGAKDTSGVKP